MIKFFLIIFSIIYTVSTNKCWKHDILKHYFIKMNDVNWIEIEYSEGSFTLMNHLKEDIIYKKKDSNETILLKDDITYFKLAFNESSYHDINTINHSTYLNGSWKTDIECKLILNQINNGNYF